MADLEITGTEQFVRMAKKLNEQGKAGRGLWRELNSQLKESAEPMADAVKNHLGHYLPNRYAGVLKGALVIRVSRSTRGNSPGLKLVAKAKGRGKNRHIRVINDGTLRHPVFTTKVWVDQGVRPGFWTEPLIESREIPAKHIRRAIQTTIRKIEG